jgi:glycosyltransferase involved in cell wall biosynthesis
LTTRATVVIATKDRADQLRVCLAALENQGARASFDVVVVDNGSRDATPAVIAAAPADRVRGVYVAQPNRAKARNAGIAAAQGEIIIFCDDDTIAPQHFVAAHLQAHAAEPGAVVTGPIINVPDAANLRAPSKHHWSRAFFCTCNASVAKDSLVVAGGFDERYDLYGWEDTDLGVRLKDNGLRHVFSWQAYIYHIKPPQTQSLDQRQALAREKGEMAARFVRKSPRWPVKLATGAYGINFARAAVLGMPPLRALFERAARSGSQSMITRLAVEALVDGSYVGALRKALRQS